MNYTQLQSAAGFFQPAMFQLLDVQPDTSPPGMARCLSQWWLGLTGLERWSVPDPGVIPSLCPKILTSYVLRKKIHDISLSHLLESIHPIVRILVYDFGTYTNADIGKNSFKIEVQGCRHMSKFHRIIQSLSPSRKRALSLSLSLPLQLYHSVWSISFCGQWIKTNITS